MPRTKKPVTIRGRTFESGYAAAKHFGVKPQTIYAAKFHGTLDRVGFPKGFLPRPIEIDGVVYKSAAAAMEEIGCSRTHIHRLLKRGRARWLARPEKTDRQP